MSRVARRAAQNGLPSAADLPRGACAQRLRRWLVAASVALVCSGAAARGSEAPREIDRDRLSLVGLSAVADTSRTDAVKNHGTGVVINVYRNGQRLDASELGALMGSGVTVRATLSGPGLASPVSLSGP